jgi:hypothetical protein
MRGFIARENVRRFEKQLAGCSDPKQREVLLQLLEAERQRLADAEINDQPQISPENRS